MDRTVNIIFGTGDFWYFNINKTGSHFEGDARVLFLFRLHKYSSLTNDSTEIILMIDKLINDKREVAKNLIN